MNVSNAAETQSKQATPELVMSSSLAMLFPQLRINLPTAKKLPAIIHAHSLHVHAIYMCQQCMPGAVIEAIWHESFMHVVYMCKQTTCASSVCQGLSFKPHGMSHES